MRFPAEQVTSGAMNHLIHGFGAALALLGLVACGPQTSRLQSGDYEGATTLVGTELAGTTLSLQLESATARVGLADGSHVDLTLTRLDEGSWEIGCPTQFSHVRLETWSVAPSPLELQGLSLSEPRLTAGCAEAHREAVLQGRSADSELSSIYRRR
jgi:hypothetical protein